VVVALVVGPAVAVEDGLPPHLVHRVLDRVRDVQELAHGGGQRHFGQQVADVSEGVVFQDAGDGGGRIIGSAGGGRSKCAKKDHGV